MGSPSRSGPAGRGEASGAESESGGGEARAGPAGRAARGPRRKGKGKPGGRGRGRGSAPEGTPGGEAEEAAGARGPSAGAEGARGGRDAGGRPKEDCRARARPGRLQGRGAQAGPEKEKDQEQEQEQEEKAEEEAGARESALWRLPEELLLLICSYLDVRALGRLAQVCRWLRRFTGCDLLWRRIARASLNAGFSPLGTDL